MLQLLIYMLIVDSINGLYGWPVWWIILICTACFTDIKSNIGRCSRAFMCVNWIWISKQMDALLNENCVYNSSRPGDGAGHMHHPDRHERRPLLRHRVPAQVAPSPHAEGGHDRQRLHLDRWVHAVLWAYYSVIYWQQWEKLCKK